MKTTITILALAAAVAATAPAAAQKASQLPKRPEEIKFKPLAFNAPKASDYRHVLSNGIVVYLAPSTELPLIDLTLSFRGGDYLDPADKVGLGGMTAAMLRTGGTESLAPAELDEKLDFLATEIAIGARGTSCSASVDCLKANFDESLALLMDMLRRPRFDEGKQKIAVDDMIEQMKQRNDDADPILGREWNMALYGEDHFEAREPTEASVRGITRADMAAYAARVFNPGNMIVAVSGDFEPKAMLAKLEAAFSTWTKGERMAEPPAPTAEMKPGVYHVEKEIPQGKVYIGRRSITRDDPDYFAALVMNEILGGGGFTSRIMKTVRSDEGLAYSAGSSLDAGVWYPGEFRAGFQSKNPTVALAIKLIENEFEKMRTTEVSAEELEVAKKSFIETFPRTFESKPTMLGIFVGDEWTGRDPAYWQTYRENVSKVTAADVKRVAQRMLDMKNMAIFVVGDWDTIAPGDPTGRAKMADFFNDQAEHLPLRDPMTMQPVK
ncbi:MAG: M16 family metallopeptidase [Phycisphaerales bacterium]